jgi:hypothetical protein
MSSSKQPSTDAASAEAPQTDTEAKADDDMLRLLNEKDEEIKGLKQEIKVFKQTIAWQQNEIKRLKGDTKASAKGAEVDLTNESIKEIANESIKTVSGTSKVEARWKNRFQQLVAYKLAHGDCNVSKSYQDKSLHAWVRTQRESKKDFDKKKTGCKMTQERVDALNNIGFQWVVGHQPNDAAWEEMFQTLMQYKQQHGHTRVSSSENKQLYKWVLNQRARRRLLETNGEGKAKGMTWARVEKLNAIDFIWEANPRRGTAADPESIAQYAQAGAFSASPTNRSLPTPRQARSPSALYKYEA